MSKTSTPFHDIILHIGLPKTGTSAIQKFCVENRQELEAHGIYYPKHSLDKNGVSGGHSELYKNYDTQDRDAAKAFFLKNLAIAKEKKCSLLISNEGLHVFSSQISEDLAEFSTKIIAFFRHPFDSLFSAYNQMIKRHFLTESVHTYAEQALRFDKPILMGKTLLDWNEECNDELIVKPYSNELSGKNSAIFQFLQALNTDLLKNFSDLPAGRINPGYCLAALEVKRLLNLVVSKKDQALNKKLDAELQQISESGTFLATHLQNLLPEDQIHALLARFQNGVECIEQTFNITLPQPEKPDFSAFSPLQALEQEIAVIKHIKESLPSAYAKIGQRLTSESFVLTSSDHFKLCQLFDVKHAQNPDKLTAFFSEKTIQDMLDYKDVDFLRETTKVLIRRGNFHQAMLLIERALEIRPKGPVLLKLHQDLQQLSN